MFSGLWPNTKQKKNKIMCDTIKKRNVKPPQYTYKVVTKIKNGVYASPVMGAPMLSGRWLVAPKIPAPSYIQANTALARTSLISKAFSKYKTFKLYRKKSSYISSSLYSDNHVGKWGSFASLNSAKSVNLVKNFRGIDSFGEQVIVKCEIGGECHSSLYGGQYKTFLSERIKIIEEVV